MKKYEKNLLTGDFNVALAEPNKATFWNEYKLKVFNKEPTFSKNYMSPSCIDLYLKNCPKSFKSTITIKTGFSEFHKLIVTVLKVKHFDSTRFFEKLQVVITYLDKRSFECMLLSCHVSVSK